jgi:DNA-binding GntR family transcriptional regulator
MIATYDLEAEPIFALLEQPYGIPLVEAEYRLEAASADRDVVAALGVAACSPAFLIERTSCAAGNAPDRLRDAALQGRPDSFHDAHGPAHHRPII